MSLYKYDFTFAGLSQSERNSLNDQIEAISYNGVFTAFGADEAYFFVDEKDSDFLEHISFPASCHLTRSL
jgi:hypothetical protein